jgi:hypothetical protein
LTAHSINAQDFTRFLDDAGSVMNKITGPLAVAVVLAGTAAIHFWTQLEAKRLEAAELAVRETALKSALSLQADALKLPEPATSVVMPSAQPAAAQAPIAAPPATQPAASSAASPPLKGLMEAMATPEGMDATRSMMRAMMAQMYPDVEQELGLTPAEKQKLFDLLSDPGQDPMAFMASGAQDAAAREEMQRKMVESARAQEAKLSALLGSKYPKWQDYQSTAQARQQVDQLRRTLSGGGTPLSEVQTNQLVTAFAAEQKRADKETRDWSMSVAAINSPDMMQETVKRTIESQSRLVGVAAPILDTAQLDRFKRQVEQQTTMLRATMSMMGVGGQP